MTRPAGNGLIDNDQSPVADLSFDRWVRFLTSSQTTPKPSRLIWQKWWMGCAGIWAIALAVRLLHLWLLQGSPLSYVLMGDAKRYHEWAVEIAQGNWLGTESFYQAPLYPYFMGGLYWIFGVDQTTVRIAQAILGATACVGLACAGRRFFSPKTGLLAGGLFAVYAPAIFFDGIIQKASLDGFLVAMVLAVMGSLAHRPRRVWLWGVLGFLLGAWILTRENAVILVLLLPLWLAFGWGKTSRLARVGWLASVGVGLALILFPVALRNRVVGGEWHLTTSQFGPNFFIGNSELATGRYMPLRQDRGSPEYERIDATELAEADLGRKLTPGEVSTYWTQRTFEDIHSDWPRWIRLLTRKWFLVWNATEIIDTEDIYTYGEASWLLGGLLPVWHLGCLAPLAALGMVLAWKSWRRQGVLALFVIAYALSVSLFYVFARYRFPLVPPLILLAAAGLLKLPAYCRRRRFGWLTTAFLCAFAVAYWTNLPGEPRDPMRSNTHYMLAVNLERMGGDVKTIEREYDLAELLDPLYAEVLRMRANFEWQRGQIDRALEYYERCVALDGGFVLARYDYGLALFDLRRYQEALEQFGIVNHFEPGFAEGWLQYIMGAAQFNLRRYKPAEQHFRAAMRLGRNEPEIHRGLARALMGQGRFREAIVAFQQLLELDPKDWNAEILVGNCHQQLNEVPQAIVHWERALKEMPVRNLESLQLANKVRLLKRQRTSPIRRGP